MTDTHQVKTWALPFKAAGDASKAVTDPQLYYDALAQARGGFYPMGANGLWHGGVHFDAGTGALLDQSSVRCIADGEVIAYRIDEHYPTSQYGEGPTAVHLPFSTGFVLVKHRLALPPATTPTAAPSAETLTFYSLYMHLLDWNGYQTQIALERPNFWGEGLYQVKATAPDKVLGLNVRANYKGQAGYETLLTTLPRGTRVQTGAASPNGKWLQLVSVTPNPAGLPPATGWVFKAEMQHLDDNSYLIADQAKDAPATPQQGLNVRAAADKHSDILAVLPHGTQIKISNEGAVGGYRKLVAIVSGVAVPALTPGESAVLPGFVWLDFLEAKHQPKDKDRVYLLPTPAPIKAGELIGHLGQYQSHNDARPKTLLHLEVFSCDDVPAFIAQSRARAASLPDSAKTLLRVQPGTKLITHTASMCAATPPRVSDPGSTIGVSRSIPLAVLNNLPAERKIQTSTPMAGGPAVITNWWHLNNEFADKDGNLISGWLADIIPTRHSPWEWQGFDFISETTSASEQLANHLAGQCLLSEAELPDYQMHISTADSGPIKTRLYDIIDGADGTARNEKLSVAEISAALGKPWHAQSISQLISHYESEWYWQDGKWDELDKLMEHTPADPNPNWIAEKARIKTLSWWDQVAGQHGIQADGMAWHFHPLGPLGNFYVSRMRRDYELGSLSSHYETGGRGSRTISGGAGDAGGASYGSYQMTSQIKLANGTIITGGTVKQFVHWGGMPWASEFTELTPGSSAFSDKWRELVDTKGQEFIDVEHEYIKVSHFDVQIQKVIADTGVYLRYHSRTVNDVVWSTAVQQGPSASIIVNAINKIGTTSEETKLYDEKLIDAIYTERGRRVVGGDKNGQLYYFSKNSIAVQNGVAERFISEKTKAQERLKNEIGY